MIVAASDDNSNYTFTTNEQGSFRVKMESPDTRYVMPTTTTGYYGPNSTITLQSGVDYTNFRVKSSDGTVKDVGAALELTEENTVDMFSKSLSFGGKLTLQHVTFFTMKICKNNKRFLCGYYSSITTHSFTPVC